MNRQSVTSIQAVLLWLAICMPAKAVDTLITLTPGSQPNRIYAGTSSNEHWIVNFGYGLIRLLESPPGVWSTEYFSIPHAVDATGPDSQGNIYVSAHSEQPHVFIFNINSQTIVDSIPVYDSEWRYPSALVLSSDETKLYLCAFAWPAIGEGFRWGNTGASHADTGRVFEINLSTKNILRTVNVGALPQSIYLTPYNTLLVSTDEEYPIVEPTSPEVLLHTGAFEYLDIIAIPAFQRTARIECNSYPEYFTNTFSPWSDDGRYVAMCNPESFYLPSHPAFNDGIWVIDSYSGAVTSTINIAIGDYRYGARSLIVSHVCDGEAYVALNQCGNSNANRIAVVDHATGDCLGSLDTGTEITPVFMHELPDGRLIVTGGASGKIAIIDPT